MKSQASEDEDNLQLEYDLKSLRLRKAGARRQRFNGLPISLEPDVIKEKRGWQAIVGTFVNDPYYEEAMRLGRAWRESQGDELSEEAR